MKKKSFIVEDLLNVDMPCAYSKVMLEVVGECSNGTQSNEFFLYPKITY